MEAKNKKHMHAAAVERLNPFTITHVVKLAVLCFR